MFSSVDLPLPEAPTIATSSPAPHQQVQALQGLDFDTVGLVDPDQVVADDLGVPAVDLFRLRGGELKLLKGAHER